MALKTFDSHIRNFIKNLIENEFSSETIDSYEKTLRMLFAFVSSKYVENEEIYNINSRDIKDFLRSRIEAGNDKSTVNKHLSIIKKFFDYLWNTDNIPVDPAVKIKRYKIDNSKVIESSYSILQDILPKVINHPDYSLSRKAVFLLCVKGLKSSEFHFCKNEVEIKGCSVSITLNSTSIDLHNQEAACFIEFYQDQLFQPTDFVFTTRKHDKSYIPITSTSIMNHLNQISVDYQLPEKLNVFLIRNLFAHYLYTKERYSIQEIAKKLRITEQGAAALIKSSLERKAGTKLI